MKCHCNQNFVWLFGAQSNAALPLSHWFLHIASELHERILHFFLYLQEKKILSTVFRFV